MSETSLDIQSLRRRLERWTKLAEQTSTLAAFQDLDEILATVTRGVCEIMACERASLYRYDTERRELSSRVVTDLEIQEIRSSIDLGINGWVARRRKVANIPHPPADARWNSAVDRKTSFQTRNILAAPLISVHDDRLIGVLQLLNKTEGQFDEFDEHLIQAFAMHVAGALERTELLDETKKSQQLRLSLEMGRSIQESFLPAELPEIPGYELAAWQQPAEEVSGDYYDVLPLPDRGVGLAIADVSGHGVGPSLIMASARAMLHVLARSNAEPGQILSLLSDTIAPDLNSGLFITFLFIALDPTSHEYVYSNAGHGPALHFQSNDRHCSQIESTGLPIGFSESDVVPSRNGHQLEPGDLLLLATDGAIELKNESGEMFGRQRLERLLQDNHHRTAAELLDIIGTAVRDFHPANAPPDDVTVMVVKRKPL
jgi:phosphoserine phosphatase